MAILATSFIGGFVVLLGTAKLMTGQTILVGMWSKVLVPAPGEDFRMHALTRFLLVYPEYMRAVRIGRVGVLSWRALGRLCLVRCFNIACGRLGRKRKWAEL